MENELKRGEIRKALLSKRGAMADLARELGITITTVSLVLKGKTKSARSMAAAEAKAREILASEAAQ